MWSVQVGGLFLWFLFWPVAACVVYSCALSTSCYKRHYATTASPLNVSNHAQAGCSSVKTKWGGSQNRGVSGRGRREAYCPHMVNKSVHLQRRPELMKPTKAWKYSPISASRHGGRHWIVYPTQSSTLIGFYVLEKETVWHPASLPWMVYLFSGKKNAQSAMCVWLSGCLTCLASCTKGPIRR